MKTYYAIEHTARGVYLLKKIISYGYFSGAIVIPVDSIPYASEQSARNAAALKGLQIAKSGGYYSIV